MRTTIKLTTITLAALTVGSFLNRAAMAQATRPALDAIERDVRTLYQSSQRQIVRVTVPIILPTRIVEQEHPLVKWRAQIDPKILQVLAAQQRGGAPMVFVEPPRPATTQSATPSAAQPSTRSSNQASTQAMTSAQMGDAGRIPLPPQTTTINAEFIGLVLDTGGDVLVPLYIDKDYLKGPLQVTL